MKARSMWTTSAVVALALVGCGGLELTHAVQGLIGCDEITCSNSPNLLTGFVPDIGAFHELSLSGIRNNEAMRIITSKGRAQIYKGHEAYDLEVRQGRLMGTAGTTVLQAGDLVDAEIAIGMPRGGPMFTLHITNVRRFPMPFDQGREVETYRITLEGFVGPEGAPSPFLCDSASDSDSMGDSMEPGEVVVFEGDRIDVASITMSSQREPDWFNFGCAGSALAKLYLMGETFATQPPPDDTSWQEHQAMLKMLVADYCGTGRIFTVPGEPLLWQGGRISYALPPLNLEARWNANGAICLGTPRLDVYPDPMHSSTGITAEIAANCGDRMPPLCANTDLHDYDGAIVVSANRP